MLKLSLNKRHAVAAAGALATLAVSIAPAFASTTFHLSVSGSTTVFPIHDDIPVHSLFAPAVGSNADTDFFGGPTTGTTWSDVASLGGDTSTGVNSGGSDTGVSDVMMGRDDIGDSSRPLQTSPTNDNTCGMAPKTGHECTSPQAFQISDIDQWPVALDGITIIDSTATGGLGTNLPNLTVAQLALIYSCDNGANDIHTWGDVFTKSGVQAPAGLNTSTTVVAYSRATSSGTYGDFLGFIGVPKPSEQACVASANAPVKRATGAGGNPDMVQDVQNNPTGSIAYVGLAFSTGSNLGVVQVNGVTPTIQTIVNRVKNLVNGTSLSPAYQFGRQLFFMTPKHDSLVAWSSGGIIGNKNERLNNYARAIGDVNTILGINGQVYVNNEGSVPLQSGANSDGVVGVTVGCQNVGTPAVNACAQHIPDTDVNVEGVVNVTALSAVGSQFLAVAPAGELGGWTRADVNSDGVINVQDLSSVGQKFLFTWSKWQY